MSSTVHVSKTKRWRLLGTIGLIAAVMMAASWWIMLPKRTADRFISLMSSGQLLEADAMLLKPSSIELDADGGVLITSNDGNAITITAEELPFSGLDDFYYQPRTKTGDYLAGRYRFPVITSGVAVHSEQQEPLTVFAMAKGDRVVILTAK